MPETFSNGETIATVVEVAAALFFVGAIAGVAYLILTVRR